MPGSLDRDRGDPSSLAGRSFSSPNLAEALPDYVRPQARGLEVPAVPGIGVARAMARAYGCFAMGGAELGLTPATLRLRRSSASRGVPR
jgi:hypothetical protein